jgi:acetylglutamate kinase
MEVWESRLPRRYEGRATGIRHALISHTPILPYSHTPTPRMSSPDRAQTLIEALPYFRQFQGRTMVIKYGGNAMVDESLKAGVMQDILLMHTVGICPVLVHGGGPEINEAMEKVGKEPEFVGGLRVTDAETMEIVEMVLAGKTNKGIVALLNAEGGRAVGLSGKDANLLVAEAHHPGGVDLGYVGTVTQVNTAVLRTLAENGYIPVVCSVAIGPGGETYNVNADHAAGQIAAALGAEKLVLLTDVVGILRDKRDPASLVSRLTAEEARGLIVSGAVDRGMIPKVEGALMAVEGGVSRAHILDGRVPHALLTELFTDAGVGTMIESANTLGLSL